MAGVTPCHFLCCEVGQGVVYLGQVTKLHFSGSILGIVAGLMV